MIRYIVFMLMIASNVLGVELPMRNNTAKTATTSKTSHSKQSEAKRPQLLMDGKPLGASNSLTILNALDAFRILLCDLTRHDEDLREDVLKKHTLLVRAIKSSREVSTLMSAVAQESKRSIENVKALSLYSEPQTKGAGKIYQQIVHLFETRFSDASFTLSRLRTGLWKMDQLLVDTEVACWRAYRQVVQFLTKLKLDAKWLKREMLETYKNNLEEVRSFSRKGYPAKLIRAVRRVIHGWLDKLDLSEMIPQHGNGSVAEGSLTRYQKDLAFRSDQLLDYVVARATGTTVVDWMPLDSSIVFVDALQRTSRLCFVPKTISKLRTICAEPATLQYFQQGIMNELYKFIVNSEVGNFFNPYDQRPNQHLAKVGSDDYLPTNSWQYSTIDLSMASDSVSWTLVKQLFQGTVLYPWLVATRSTHVLLPDGEVEELPIFAPMGSALCFPVQALIYAAVCEVTRQDSVLLPEFTPGGVQVFGDDIVVPTVIAQAVIENLFSLGFKPNLDKTFVNGNFRESCGKEYLHGFDVTPIYYRVKYNDSFLTPASYVALITAANNAYNFGLTSLADSYKRALLDIPKTTKSPKLSKLVPVFTEDGTGGSLATPTASNYHLPSRWNKNTQQGEIRVLSAVAKRSTYHEPYIPTQYSQMGLYKEKFLRTKSSKPRDLTLRSSLRWLSDLSDGKKSPLTIPGHVETSKASYISELRLKWNAKWQPKHIFK